MTDASLLRTLIVEDELPAREYLVELLEGSKLAAVVGAVGTVDEARQALSASTRLTVDAVFVDIRLAGSGDASGLELVRGLVGKPNAPMFVLATAFKEHAVEAFNLDVVDYLLKPFTEERVEECLRRLLARRPSTPPPDGATRPRIVARRGKTLVFLEPEEVWAFEASERLTSVHTPHGVFDVDLSLSVIELSFGRALMRVHRNWLVNAAYIKELDREGRETRIFVGVGIGPDQRGVRVPVGRDRAQAVRDMLLTGATGVRRGA
ncbi:MAG: Two-component system response regulator [Myxococcaceae bacterium]|nr:Two-component system response regulator [Myxococcaceae bacterium]